MITYYVRFTDDTAAAGNRAILNTVDTDCVPEAPGEDSLGPLQPVPPRKPGTMGGGARPKFEMNYSSDVDWTQRHEKGKAR